MEFQTIILAGGISMFLLYLFWRYVWFFRNPKRMPPHGDSFVSPADGRVVYVEKVESENEVISVKKGISATIKDITREDLALPKLLVGIFMSPFDVHYNRAPLRGKVEYVQHYPSRLRNVHMGSMHLRSVLRLKPYYKNSLHILQNERTVTKIVGSLCGVPIPCYVIQIAGGSVKGIESFVQVGDTIEKGSIFGMIRIGSQVDVVVPLVEGMKVRVAPGDKVRAGETVLIE